MSTSLLLFEKQIMNQFANPVARLLAVWTEAMATGKGNVRTVWAEVFQVDQNDTYGILRGIGQLLELAAQGKSLVQQISVVDKELHMKPLKEIESVLNGTINFDLNWADVRNRVAANATLEKLAFCAERIEQEQFEILIEEQQLEELLGKVNDLLAEIGAADITQNLKSLLVENLENFRRAILEYRITGSKGIEKAINIAIGSLVRQQKELKTSDGKKWGTKFWKILASADGLISASLKIASVLGNVMNLLDYNGDGKDS